MKKGKSVKIGKNTLASRICSSIFTNFAAFDTRFSQKKVSKVSLDPRPEFYQQSKHGTKAKARVPNFNAKADGTSDKHRIQDCTIIPSGSKLPGYGTFSRATSTTRRLSTGSRRLSEHFSTTFLTHRPSPAIVPPIQTHFWIGVQQGTLDRAL